MLSCVPVSLFVYEVMGDGGLPEIVSRLHDALYIEILRKYFRYARKRGRFVEYSGRNGFARWREAHPFLARHIVRTYGDPSGHISISPDRKRIVFIRQDKDALYIDVDSTLNLESSLDCKKVASRLAGELFAEHVYHYP